jgi:hypothetical protein
LRKSRLRALSLLLEYALAESKELGSPHLDQALHAAILAIVSELAKLETRSPGANGSCEIPPST